MNLSFFTAPKIATTRDLDIAYYDIGPPDGKVVILLHGFPYDPHAFLRVVELLSQHDYRCIVPYLRGYGPTKFRLPTVTRSGQQAALGCDLLGLLDALGIEKALLGGYD